MTQEERKVLERAIHHFGETMQRIVAMEEMSELTKEITKALRGRLSTDHMAEEIADVGIMLDQLAMMYECEDAVRYWRSTKIARLELLLKQ